MLYPKIGIRPVIDGRWGGVRESLEAQTMGMAKAAKALIEGSLRYPDGTPVQCVLSDTTIGGGAFKDVYSVMANWGANHGVTVYGHVGADLITLASMLRIPVNMHNVEPGRIFRPHAWSGFGTEDAESADYRACAAYGPLYQ